MAKGKTPKSADPTETKPYKHSGVTTPARPEVGTQAQFKKKKPPVTYRYDSSLAPALDWDSNPARVQGEKLIDEILSADSIEKAKAAASKLKSLGKPFLNWAGKAEHLSFEVPTFPLFVHERLSTQAIIETLKGHKRPEQQTSMFELFSDPQRSITDQVLKAYEHRDQWVNRMILGDSLVVMNSLLHYEGMGGQVQMIYMDPPYGVNYGSNFQPYVRKKDVKHGDDEYMTREPEMVLAYRDTWELGLHSYLSYLRDRLLLCRELLTNSGSIFIQISDDNLHHVREVLDDIFGSNNFCRQIAVRKTSGLGGKLLNATADYLLWYAKDKDRVKFNPIFREKNSVAEDDSHWKDDGKGHIYTLSDLTAQFSDTDSCIYEFTFEGETYRPSKGRQWKTTIDGMQALAKAGRLEKAGSIIRYKRYLSDFPFMTIGDTWDDLGGSVQSRSDPKIYVVQTGSAIPARCIQMTTDPGDLILDPTCGSGTTAYAAEEWGRRWITADVSRVPLSLARQRLLSAVFDWYDLKEPSKGPTGGFVYSRKRTAKGIEVGGIVPHITMESFAKGRTVEEEVLVDRPDTKEQIVRVTGPLVVEATIPIPVDIDGAGVPDSGETQTVEYGAFVDRMLEVLRVSPVLQLTGGKTVKLKQIRPPAKSLSLSAEALAENGKDKPVAIVFGPENGSVSERLVYEAAREAHAKRYEHLYVIGFHIQPHARMLIENCAEAVGIPATYNQATPDLTMGDLLKNMRSSQIFSVCGLPEIKIRQAKEKKYQIELEGLDVFDPITMENVGYTGSNVPAWFLDHDYNGLVFHVNQAFFPRTGAWEKLKKALKGNYDETVWDHLAGTISAPFEAGEHKQVAVKVIDDRGNELMVVKNLGKD